MITKITFELDHLNLTTDVEEQIRRLTPDSFQQHSEFLAGVPAHEWLSCALRQLSEDCVTIERTPGWNAGWNIPGCLPDEEPQTFKEFADACEYLAEELERARDDHSDNGVHADTYAMYDEAAAQVRKLAKGTLPFWVKVGAHAWWVAREQ